MPVFTVHQAKTQLSKLLAQVGKGEAVVIARGSEPVARIVPFEGAKLRRPGTLKGKIALTPAFLRHCRRTRLQLGARMSETHSRQ